jgi:regulator of nonsense transcripts 1
MADWNEQAQVEHVDFSFLEDDDARPFKSKEIENEFNGLDIGGRDTAAQAPREGAPKQTTDSEGDGENLGDYDEVVDEEDDSYAPEWMCAYCGQKSNPASSVKCVHTNKWFCNGRSVKNSSCIVAHLVKANRKEVLLHKQSPLGDTILECYATGSRNVFSLGYVPCTDENTVVLLSRDIPASHPSIKDLNLDTTQWEPLIQDRAFVDWLVPHPTAEEMKRCKKLRLDEAARLEEMWKQGKAEATLDDLAIFSTEEEECLPVALHYEDASTYESLFGALIHMEAEYERMVKESQVRHNVHVTWDTALNKRHLAKFSFPSDGSESKVMVGDEMRLKHPCPSLGNPPWEGVGTVVRLDLMSEEIHLEIHPCGTLRRHRKKSKQGKKQYDETKHSAAPPINVQNGYSIEFVWRGISYERMQQALRSFVADDTSVSGYIYHTILGHTVPTPTIRSSPPKKLTAPGLPALNHSQMNAVKKVLSDPLSLIQGPPGTGKTLTSATIVYHLSKQGQGQILVAAPSNTAVDHLAERISLTGLKVVRMLSKSREEIGSSVENLTLQYQVQHLNIPAAVELQKLHLLRNELGELSTADEKKYRKNLRMLEQKVLEAADVICVTCVGSGDPRLANFTFRRVLIDEATQAVEPEALIPLVMGCKQAVFVGDHCQLGPVIVNKKAADAGLCQSLYERLLLLGIKPIRLAVQYRMHPSLSVFPSNMFYEGSLQNGVCASERLHSVGFPWPHPETPMMFWSQLGAEEISSSGTSYLNRTEANAVEKIVTHLLKHGIGPWQIGVITPYEGQRAHVVSLMNRNGTLAQNLYGEVEVASVDAFQGREKDYIILSCVRSNEHQGIGFLSDPRRLNVALTRARFGLIILGNPMVLSKQMIWSALAHHFREEGSLVEGTLKSLKPSMINLGKQRKFGMLGIGPTGMSKFRPVLNAGETFEDTRAYNVGEQRGMHSEFVRDPFSVGDFPALIVNPARVDYTDSAPLSPTTSHGSHFY